MKRENRYVVIKLKDLDEIGRKILPRLLRINKIRSIECVVVEPDWPMYEDTWTAIENWVHEQVCTGELPDTAANRNASEQPTNKYGMPIHMKP